jgi:hypothetical protein
VSMKIVPRDKVWIEGRGQLYVTHPDENPGVDLHGLMGQVIEVEDKKWKVVGVEGFAIGSHRALPAGLLVRPA